MLEHSVYAVRRYNRFWGVFKDDKVLVTFRERAPAIAFAYSLMDRGCDRLEPSKVIIEEQHQRQETKCPCFDPPPATVN
jgi:hypothetical protein